MATGQQLVMVETIPGAYWVEVTNHSTIAMGTRFLVVDDYMDCWDRHWLVGWRDGETPLHSGTLLRPEHVRKIVEP